MEKEATAHVMHISTYIYIYRNLKRVIHLSVSTLFVPTLQHTLHLNCLISSSTLLFRHYITHYILLYVHILYL